MIVRERARRRPTSREVLFLHSFPPQLTNFDGLFQCFNGRTTLATRLDRARSGQRVALHAIGMTRTSTPSTSTGTAGATAPGAS